MNFVDKNKTLEELENEIWSGNNFQTGLIEKCFKLRKKKLIYFDSEDLRLMISQKISLDYLVPFALEYLSIDLLSEGNLYPGDLLESVLNIPSDFWRSHYPIWINLYELVKGALHKIKESEDINDSIKGDLLQSFNRFSKIFTDKPQ